MGNIIAYYPSRVVEPVAVLEGGVGSVLMEGEAGGGGAAEGDSFDQDVFGMGAEGEVGSGGVDGAHVAFDGDVFGVDEYG